MSDVYPYSRFIKTSTTTFRNVETYDVWVRPSFLTKTLGNDEIGVFTVEAQYEGRPDNIAYLLYGDHLLDWVIIAFNNATDVLNWPQAGSVIKYPLINVIVRELG